MATPITDVSPLEEVGLAVQQAAAARVAMNNLRNFRVSCAGERFVAGVGNFSRFAAFKSGDKSPANSPTAYEKTFFTIFRSAR